MKNQPNTNPKSRPNTSSSRVQKGSDDPIQQHNRFGALAEDGAMETDESGHPSSCGHISKLLNRKFPVNFILVKGQVGYTLSKYINKIQTKIGYYNGTVEVLDPNMKNCFYF